jgi:hypothetical protein
MVLMFFGHLKTRMSSSVIELAPEVHALIPLLEVSFEPTSFLVPLVRVLVQKAFLYSPSAIKLDFKSFGLKE